MKLKIGLETHVSINSTKKLFCNCLNNYSCCNICTGKPGGLPFFNKDFNNSKLNVLLGFFKKKEATIQFYRKHYFYYDLPTGYQRTQHPNKPFIKNVFLNLKKQKVLISKIFLEEDPAATTSAGVSYSRIGSPILQIVTEPCFQGSLEEVKPIIKEYLLTLKRLFIDLKITAPYSTLKTDVNVSLIGSSFKIEIKNLNSIVNILKAIALAVDFLKNSKKNFDMTLHYKQGKLIFARPKLNYLFYKEPNLAQIKLLGKKPPLTLYFLFNYLKKRLNVDPKILYQWVKTFLLALKNKTIKFEKTQFTKFLKLGSFKALKQAFEKKILNKQQVYFKDLKDFLKEYLNQTLVNFENKDFEKKTPCYLQFLKNLKKSLILKKVPFNSKIINTFLNEILYGPLA